MREQIPWANWLKLENAGAYIAWPMWIRLENAGADLIGEMTKTGKSGSISHGLRESDWKMREYIAWGEYLWLENAGADSMGELPKN